MISIDRVGRGTSSIIPLYGIKSPHWLGVTPTVVGANPPFMEDEPCPCCGDGISQRSTTARSSGRWEPNGSPLDAKLPPALTHRLNMFLDDGSVTTLREWANAVRRDTEGDGISIEQLCVSEGQTPHWGIVDGERYHFRCFYDAVILAAITDRPVDIHTISPHGSIIEAYAIGSESLTVSPGTAVFSFGIDDSVLKTPIDSGERLERGYAAICPYVRAFANRDAYLRWDETTAAVTVSMSLAGATELAKALVD